MLAKPVRMGTLASELTIVSRLTELALAVAELALNPVLFANGRAEGGGRVEAGGAEPPMEVANPASEGMLLAMMSVRPARVGKTAPRSDPARDGGGASSPLVGADVVTSSSAERPGHR